MRDEGRRGLGLEGHGEGAEGEREVEGICLEVPSAVGVKREGQGPEMEVSMPRADFQAKRKYFCA